MLVPFMPADLSIDMSQMRMKKSQRRMQGERARKREKSSVSRVRKLVL